MKLSLTLSYSDVPVQGTDENILRQAMHEHVLNGEIEIGAEKLGILLLLRSNIFMAPEIGVNNRCLSTKNINCVLATMTKEFKMFIDLHCESSFKHVCSTPSSLQPPGRSASVLRWTSPFGRSTSLCPC